MRRDHTHQTFQEWSVLDGERRFVEVDAFISKLWLWQWLCLEKY